MNYTYVKNKIDSLIEELQQLKAVIDSDGVVEAVTIYNGVKRITDTEPFYITTLY